MKQDINNNQFIDAFKAMGRGDQFSYEALNALYDWLENELDGEYVLDVIALCCEWTEYANVEEFNKDYSLECEAPADINDHTIVIEIPFEEYLGGRSGGGGFLIAQF